MPIGTLIYLSIETIFYAIFDVAIVLLLFDFKKERSISLAVLAVGTLFQEIDSQVTSVYLFEPTHFFNSLAYQIPDYILWFAFKIWFLCFFIKDHPVRNYAIWSIAELLLLPILGLFTIIRKSFHLGPALMYSTGLNDFPAITAIGIGLLFTYLLIKIIWGNLGQRLLNAPLTPYWCVSVVFLLVDFSSYHPSFYAQPKFTGGLPAAINLFALCLSSLAFAALAGILSAAVMEYQNTNRNLQLMQVEMELQHTYYQSIQGIQLQLRSLRHDLANHLDVIRHLSQNNGGAEDYTKALSDTCLQIDRDAQAMLRWHPFQLPQMTAKEAYAVYTYLDRLLKKQSLAWESVSVETHRSSTVHVLTVTVPRSMGQPFRKRKAKRDPYFLLTQRIAARYGGSARWEGGESCWQLIMEIKSRG